jgi:ABC-type branched-subunit amino acid transport system substrate-binding protein
MEETTPSGAKPAPKGRAVWIAVAVIVVIVVVVLAAVLGGLFAPAARPALRIGSLLSLTGGLDDFGPGNTKGAQLAVEQINAAGGVLGQQVQLFSEDDQTDATAAAGAATKLITTNRVNAIVGAQFSGGTIASLTIAKSSGVPLVSPSATSPALSDLSLTGGWFFRTTPNDNLQGVVAADYLYKNLSLRYVNIMARNDAYGNGLAGVVNTRFTALGGTVNRTEIVPLALADYSSNLQTVFASNPQAVYFIAFTDEGLTIMKQWQQGLSANPGWDRKWVFAEGLKSQLLMDQLRDPSVGVDVTKIQGTNPVTGFGSVYASFESQYKARFFGQTPVLYTDNAYDAAYVIALAAQKAGAVDGASIKAQIPSVATPPGTVIKPGEWSKAMTELAAGRDIDWEGAAGSENFDANGDVTGPYEIWGVNSTFQLYRVAFIPESLIQPAPPLPSQTAPPMNGFLDKVQAIVSSRWD